MSANNETPTKTHTGTIILSVILIISIVLLSIGTYQYLKISKERDAVQENLTQMSTELASYESMLNELQRRYTLSEENGDDLLERLEDEKDKNDDFEDKLDDISDTVGDLNKLAELDPELLQKYSRVFFLNEHFAPEKFKEIDSDYVFNDEAEYINTKVEPFLDELLEDANDDGINLLVLSAFRSFNEQSDLKSNYKIIYGEGANAFSADQGYSEHQLGTAVDFTTPEIGASLAGFQNTEASSWLLKNAHKYGFVLSYPEGNEYYVFEPWHWRFVGEDLADDLDDDGKYFYDLDQRDIDKYLLKIFD